jgi:hypothetical protein
VSTEDLVHAVRGHRGKKAVFAIIGFHAESILAQLHAGNAAKSDDPENRLSERL